MIANASIILAAGQGKRMKTSLPKVLHPVAGRPMISYPVELIKSLGIEDKFAVLGYQFERIKTVIEKIDQEVVFIQQKEQLGTAHALQEAEPFLKNTNGMLLVLAADVPLLKKDTIQKMIDYHQHKKNSCTLLTVKLDDPHGYGRIIRNELDEINEIVEQADLFDEQNKIKEINSGIYCFNCPQLLEALSLVKRENFQKEYYLTDVIKIMRQKGCTIGSVNIDDATEIKGINSQLDLADVSQLVYQQNGVEHMNRGVTIISPSNTFIEKGVRIGNGTTVHPFTIITTGSQIESNCQIGPYSYIIQSHIGEQTRVVFSTVESSIIGKNSNIGPYARIRPETVVSDDVKIGNYVEIKKSFIGPGSKVSHLSYLGDTTLGKNVNIGAGTITCNYDGFQKNNTIIEDGVFIGSNNALVAPVIIGEDSYTAAGSTITENVPPYSLGIARSRQKNIVGWVKKKNIKKNSKKKEE